MKWQDSSGKLLSKASAPGCLEPGGGAAQPCTPKSRLTLKPVGARMPRPCFPRGAGLQPGASERSRCSEGSFLSEVHAGRLHLGVSRLRNLGRAAVGELWDPPEDTRVLCASGLRGRAWGLLKTLPAINALSRVHSHCLRGRRRKRGRATGRQEMSGLWPQRNSVSPLEEKGLVWGLRGFNTLLTSGTGNWRPQGQGHGPELRLCPANSTGQSSGRLLLPEGGDFAPVLVMLSPS